MKKANKFDFKTLLVMVLSLCLCLSVALVAACEKTADNSSSSSSAKEETYHPTDTQKVTNGDFEFSTFDKKEAKDFPVQSSIGWVRSLDSLSSTADSSSYPSGIISTSDDLFNANKENKDKGYPATNPKTPFVDHSDLIDSVDIPANAEEENNEDGKVMKGDKVLMIHNEIKSGDSNNGAGTAQKFTSNSTLDLGRHEYGKISVWVNTQDLKSKVEDVDFGAYIAIKNTTVNSDKPLVVKNINTNGKWVKYTFFLEPSNLSKTTYKVVVGLGFGSSDYKREYVQGYAFFDNVHYEVIDQVAYNDNVNGRVASEGVEAIEAVQDENKVNIYNITADETPGTALVEDDKIVKNETGKITDTVVERRFALSHKFNGNKPVAIAGTFDPVADNKIDTVANINNDELKALNGYTGNVAYFDHKTAKTSTFTTEKIVVSADNFVIYSFWVNAHVVYPNQKGLTITLRDYGTSDTNKDPVKTEIASSVVTDDDENDTYGNWRQYVVILRNDTNTVSSTASDNRYFDITFDFGTTDKHVNSEWDLTEGFAAVANVETIAIDEETFNSIDDSAYSYTKKVTLKGEFKKDPETKVTDEDKYSMSYGINDKVVIESGLAENVIGYTGIVGNTKATGNLNNNANPYDAEGNVLAGVFNTKHFANYPDTLFTADEKTALNNLPKLEMKKDENGNSVLNSNLQSLVIKNVNKYSYGFVGTSATFAPHTTNEISFKIKVIGDNAFANFYIVTSDALEGFHSIHVKDKDWTFENDKLTVAEDFTFDKEMNVKFDKTDDNNWIEVSIVVVTGDTEISYRPEFWNGSRDGDVTNATDAKNSQGIVVIDDYKVSTTRTLAEIKSDLELKGDSLNSNTKFATRRPTTINYKDGKEDKVKYTTYTDKVAIYGEYTNSNTYIFDNSIIDVEHVIDEEPTTPDTDEDSTAPVEPGKPDEPFNWALQLTSIIIASVLIVLLIVLLVRALVKKHNKKKSSSVSYYSRDSRDEANRKIEAKKAKVNADKNDSAEEEVKPYDYDNMENNIVDDTKADAEENNEAENVETETTADEANAENADSAEEEVKPEGENN